LSYYVEAGYLHRLILPFRPLFFYVAFNSFGRDISSGTNEIRTCPKGRELFKMRKFLSQYSGSITFDAKHNLVWGNGWWSGNKKMYVVRHYFHSKDFQP